jgi:dipeptidase E
VPGRVLAIGGFSLGTRFDDLVLELARGRRVLFVPTAAGDAQRISAAFYESFGPRAEAAHLSFNPWPPEDLRDLVLAHDVVYVSGGNTANALAIWRVHGFDAILREAWDRGALLCGWSAGMICWFEASVTDSFGPQLAGMRDGLGFLPGSACPHYDGEERRRPVYTSLVRDGFPAGIACDDAAAALYEGTELVEVVAREHGARAYRVGRDGEEPLDARLL